MNATHSRSDVCENWSQRPSLERPTNSRYASGLLGTLRASSTRGCEVNASKYFFAIMRRIQFHVSCAPRPCTNVDSTHCPSELSSRSYSAARMPCASVCAALVEQYSTVPNAGPGRATRFDSVLYPPIFAMTTPSYPLRCERALSRPNAVIDPYTRPGLSSFNSVYPRPSRSATPGRKVSMSTSASHDNPYATSRSLASRRSSSMLFLPRAQNGHAGWVRSGLPPGGSTCTTSAPKSAKS